MIKINDIRDDDQLAILNEYYEYMISFDETHYESFDDMLAEIDSLSIRPLDDIHNAMQLCFYNDSCLIDIIAFYRFDEIAYLMISTDTMPHALHIPIDDDMI